LSGKRKVIGPDVEAGIEKGKPPPSARIAVPMTSRFTQGTRRTRKRKIIEFRSTAA
jgi:hypothetical protein